MVVSNKKITFVFVRILEFNEVFKSAKIIADMKFS